MRLDLSRVRTLVRELLAPTQRRTTTRPAAPARPRQTPSPETGEYAGDFQGLPTFEYAPAADGRPDPGEVVWTWVPYEEDHSRGKDRPVLLVGRDGDWLLALALTSKDHDRDAAKERAAGRHWLDLGTGPWDPRGRPSEVRLDRVLRVDADSIRREGSVLDRDRFEQVARAVRSLPHDPRRK